MSVKKRIRKLTRREKKYIFRHWCEVSYQMQKIADSFEIGDLLVDCATNFNGKFLWDGFRWNRNRGFFKIIEERIHSRLRALEQKIPEEFYTGVLRVKYSWVPDYSYLIKKRTIGGFIWYHILQNTNNIRFLPVKIGGDDTICLKTLVYTKHTNKCEPRTIENSTLNFFKIDVHPNELTLANKTHAFLADLFNGAHNLFISAMCCIVDRKQNLVLLVDPPKVLIQILDIILGDLIYRMHFDTYFFDKKWFYRSINETKSIPYYTEVILCEGGYIDGFQPVSKRITYQKYGHHDYEHPIPIQRRTICFWVASQEEYLRMFKSIGSIKNAKRLEKELNFLHCKKGEYSIPDVEIIDLAKGLIALMIQKAPPHEEYPCSPLKLKLFANS